MTPAEVRAAVERMVHWHGQAGQVIIDAGGIAFWARADEGHARNVIESIVTTILSTSQAPLVGALERMPEVPARYGPTFGSVLSNPHDPPGHHRWLLQTGEVGGDQRLIAVGEHNDINYLMSLLFWARHDARRVLAAKGEACEVASSVASASPLAESGSHSSGEPAESRGGSPSLSSSPSPSRAETSPATWYGNAAAGEPAGACYLHASNFQCAFCEWHSENGDGLLEHVMAAHPAEFQERCSRPSVAAKGGAPADPPAQAAGDCDCPHTPATSRHPSWFHGTRHTEECRHSELAALRARVAAADEARDAAVALLATERRYCADAVAGLKKNAEAYVAAEARAARAEGVLLSIAEGTERRASIMAQEALRLARSAGQGGDREA